MEIKSDSGLYKKNICYKKNNFYIKRFDKNSFISVLNFYKYSKYKHIAKIKRIFAKDFIIVFEEIRGEYILYKNIYNIITEFHLINKLNILGRESIIHNNIIDYFLYSVDILDNYINIGIKGLTNDFKLLSKKYNFFTINHGDPTEENIIMNNGNAFFIDLDDNIIAHDLLDLSKLWLYTNDDRYIRNINIDIYKLFLIYIIFHHLKQIVLLKKFNKLEKRHKEVLSYYIELYKSDKIELNMKNFGFLKIE